MRLSALLLASAIVALGTGFAVADDQSRDDHAAERGRHASRRPPNNEAAKRAQNMNGGGRVLSVEPAEGGHRVKLLKNGEVRVLVVPESEQK